MNRKLKLYQFTISHYCEKARWALDHKGLEYAVVNLLPGMHVKRVKKITSHSSVPVLAHGGQIIQGSADIISYLDQTFPENSLTPFDAEEKTQAEEWEGLADQQQR